MRAPGNRWLFRGAFVSGALLIGVLLIWEYVARTRRDLALPSDLRPVAASQFLNAGPHVAYVGARQCIACHPHEHASYNLTAHSQALSDVNLAAEPPDGEFEDSRSQRTYRVYRAEGEMRHEESIRDAGGETVVLADEAVRYVVGSGRFSRSYLVDRDGFLFESPATWYAARPGWGLSPGYEQFNRSFQRPVELKCLWCHAGRMEAVGQSPQRVAIHVQAIDCERCHGPGSLHVEKQEVASSNADAARGSDDTIVNPSRLDRQRREDLCAQCHYHSAATIELRGRSLLDYRPGNRLADFLVHFGLKTTSRRMEVVGHVEQLHLSRCYQSSDHLTCTTCHSPHAKPADHDSLVFYRNKCLTCHSDRSCGLPQAQRLIEDSSDSCVACHMPRGATDIPHFAFTHHRIGIHVPTGKDAPLVAQCDELVELDDVAWMPRADQVRNLGLGYLQLSDAPKQGSCAEVYRKKSREILEQVHQQGLEDVELRAALSRLYWKLEPARTLDHAQAVIAASHASPEAMATACFTLGSTYYNLNRPVEAKPWLERTIHLRPTADVWVMLSDCHVNNGDLDAGLEAARRASEMAPDRPRYLQRYLDLLPRSDNAARAHALEKRVQILREYQTRPSP